ncbi:beta-N-acetylhexosaminidase [Ornithinibacillus salinisoli]|uniref:Beta-N-acetylhexosaminidase n=1 Tax=Ornithinibacillus salinisoli TaxID=1848459 RepID=A0ABW4VVQ3_9BACI
MRKKIGVIGILLSLLLIIGFILIGKTFTTTQHKILAKDAPKSIVSLLEKEFIIRQSEQDIIDVLFKSAKEGTIPNVPITAGITEINEVMNQWGEPENSSTTDHGIYIDYPESNITLGYANDIVFDLRSFDQNLQQIHLEDILQRKGEPDEKLYYKDEQVDQIILVYQLGGSYQLKWILSKPTTDDPNPEVHHISVVTEKSESTPANSIEGMSLEEKIGQMIIAGLPGTEIAKETKSLINDYKLGGLIFYADNLVTVNQTKNLVNDIVEVNSANDIPLFLSVDQEGGRITRLPGGISDLPTNEEIGNINDPTLSYKIGSLLGKQVKEFGMNLNFAPVLDVNSNPNNPVINNRSYGDNASVVSELGIQTMKGIQSEQVVPVIKHFPGHGDTSVDSHLELPIVDKSMEELQNLELIPFKNAIDNGAEIIMTAHILLPEVDPVYPATLSKEILTDLLRDQLSFDGLIITDDMTMDAIESNYEVEEAAIQSIRAGSDIVLIAHGYDPVVNTMQAIKQAVQEGVISEERINESVRRILEVKQQYNMTNNKVDNIDIEKLNKQMDEVLD